MGAQQASGGLRTPGDLDTIVDSDGHAFEDLDTIIEYINPKYEGIKRFIESSAKPLSNVYSLTSPTPPTTEYYGDTDRTGDPEKTLADMADFNIDYSVMNPGLNQSINTVSNTRYAVALADAYNSWILDAVVDEYDRLKPTILVPPQMPDKAAEQIDRCAGAADFAGVTMPIGGLVPPAGDHRYEPIYDAANTHDLPIILHGNSVSAMSSRPVQAQWTETFAENHVVVFPFQLMWNMTTLLFQGVPERYPDLEFVAQEAGIAWLPYLKWRMDDHYYEYPDDSPYLTTRPGEYIDSQFYFSTQPIGNTAGHPEYIAQIIEMIGTDSIMYAADLPHFDFDPPEELFEIISSRFDDAVVRDIMGKTAATVFDLPV